MIRGGASRRRLGNSSSFSIDSWTIRGVSGEEFAVREFGNSWLVRPVAFQLIPPPSSMVDAALFPDAGVALDGAKGRV